MILNLNTLSFNTFTATGGGNPSWGTEMGQGEGYKFSFEDANEFVTALVYKSVPDPKKRIYCPLGKGGNQADDYEFVLGSLFDKIFVNGIRVDGKFLLLVTKKLVGANHVGRMTLKYNPRMTLDDVNFNEPCFEAMAKAIGVTPEGSWFVSQIKVKNQDELHFTAHVLVQDGPITFQDSEDRSKQLQRKILAYATENKDSGLLTHAENIYLDIPRQLIFYGAPGTGKSFTIDGMTDDDNSVRTTFHPDSDYASFVGAYKPTMDEVDISYVSEGRAKYAQPFENHPGKERKIVYKFVPQAFLKAYVAAWSNLDRPYYLVIEEINRGNCAQIFGDLFQLLDRNNSGSSSYDIQADEDIAKFLSSDKNGFAGLDEEQKEAIRNFVLRKDNGKTVALGQKILDGKSLLLPPNLYIWATMNTSDQSLFPIDSAFKRRWNWRYIPIDTRKENWTFAIGENRYRWGDFLDRINPEIYALTESSDKQMGYYFAKADPADGVISEETFLNKVLFYLWTDVFKDYDVSSELFKNKNQNRSFRFIDFFDSEQPNALQDFIDNFNLEIVDIDLDSIEDDDTAEGESDEAGETGGNGDTGEPRQRDYSRYSIDGSGNYNKRQTALRALRKYIEGHPTMSAAEIIDKWNAVNPNIPYFILSEAEYDERVKDYPNKRDRYWSVSTNAGEKIYITNQWNVFRMADLMNLVNNSDLGIHIEKISE